jgi:hypothetical protein
MRVTLKEVLFINYLFTRNSRKERRKRKRRNGRREK